MKKSYILLLLFFLLFHFIFPLICKFVWLEDITIYSDMELTYTGFYVNLLVLIIVIFLINKTKVQDFKQIKPCCSYAHYYYWLSFIISIARFISIGGFEGTISGAGSGAILSFLGIFFQLGYGLFFVILFSKKQININIYIYSYIVAATLMGSRSAIISVLLLYLYLPFFTNSHLYKKKMKKTLKLLAVISPLLFISATLIRTEINWDIIGRMIVGRISMIEISSIPLDVFDKNDFNNTQFIEKYGLVNQFEQSVNGILPIDLFKSDVTPNQYYRNIFLGYSEDFVQSVYTSMNLTFPVYWILLWGYSIGIIVSILLLYLQYKMLYRFKNNRYLFITSLCLVYETLYFFDIPMITQKIFYFSLSYFSLICINGFINYLKKIRNGQKKGACIRYCTGL